MSQRDPENLGEEKPYRRFYRYTRAQYDQYAQRSRATKQAIGYYCRAKYQQYGRWKYVKRALSVATVVGLFIYTGVTTAILFVNRRQLVLEQRPWVAIEKAEIRPINEAIPFGANTDTGLTYQLYGAFISLRFHLKNPGHSPATHISINGAMFARDSAVALRGFDDLQPAADRCQATQRLPASEIRGITLFPGDESYLNLWFRLSSPDVLKIRDKFDVVPMIAGCVDYISTIDDGHHRTAFVYELDKVGPNNRPAKIDPDEGDLSMSQLLMEINPTLAGDAN